MAAPRRKLGATDAWYEAEAFRYRAEPGTKRARKQVLPAVAAERRSAKDRSPRAASTKRGRPDLDVFLGAGPLKGSQVDSDDIGRPCRLEIPEDSRTATGVVLDQRRARGKEHYVAYFEPQDGHAAEFYEIELPPYEQFKLLAPGSVEVSERVAQMLPGGPALQQRDVQVRLGEPSPLGFGNICAKLIASEVAAIQKALRSGNKTAKRTTSHALGFYPRTAYDATMSDAPAVHKLVSVKRSVAVWDSVNLSSYSKYEFNIVRKSVYESEDLLKLEGIYGKGFHFCIRGRPSRPEAKPVRLEAHNPRDVQVLVKLVREYNFSNETLTLRTTWRRVVHVCPVDAQNLRLGQSEDQSDEQSDEQDDAPAWKHVGRDVEFVYNNKEYNIDEIFADDGEDKVRAVNVRDASDALELPAAEVDEILERMIHPKSSKASEEPPRAAAPTGSRPPEDAAREEPTPLSAPATTVPMPARPVTAPTPTELLESTLAPARDASAPAAAALAH
jgi:hypothetical protein